MITVFGSIGFDIIASGPKLPRPGETLRGTDFTTAPGNKGANQAVAALRAGADMRLVGCVGKDEYATGALSELTRDMADLSHVRRVNETTGIAVIFVGDGDNMIMVVPGANAHVDKDMAAQTIADMSSGDTLVLQEEIPTAASRHVLELARTKGIISIFNTAPFSEYSAELAALASIVVANETEFDGLFGRKCSAPERREAVLAHAAVQNQTIIVTLGPDGAIAAQSDGTFLSVAAPKITPLDTVGAGDTFCGYLAAGLDKGMALEAAMRRAAIAGSLACLKSGAQPAIPYAAEVDAK